MQKNEQAQKDFQQVVDNLHKKFNGIMEKLK